MVKSILPDTWDVPQVFRARLGTQAGRQRAMFAEGHLLLILHEPPQADEDTRRGRFFWRGPDGSWNSNLRGGTHALDRHIVDYAEAIERFDKLEHEAQTAAEYFAVIEGLAPIHRAARNLHDVLQEARNLVPDDRDIINFRDRAYEVERTAELLYSMAKNSLDYAVAKRAEEEARSSHQMAVAAHRLNLFVAFFFPIATLAAMFGTNLDSGLHRFLALTESQAWLLVMIVGLISGALLALYVMSRDTNPAEPNSLQS